VQRNIARGNVKNVLNRISCLRAVCANSKITARSTEAAPISVTSCKEMRNKPQSEKLNTKPNNRQPSNMGRERNLFQFIHPKTPPSKTLHDSPPISPGNAWSRPLKFATTQLPQPPPPLLLLTQGAERFLRSCQLCSHSRTSQHFMEPEGSSLRNGPICHSTFRLSNSNLKRTGFGY
jgi:hypothetical protein